MVDMHDPREFRKIFFKKKKINSMLQQAKKSKKCKNFKEMPCIFRPKIEKPAKLF